MTDPQCSSLGNEDLYTSMEEQRKKMTKIGVMTRYILKSDPLTLIQENCVRRTIGKKDNSKPHKSILMVGATGTGKSTLINAMVNHMLGVKFSDRIWYEIIETKEKQTDSQTKTVTVYDVHAEQSPFSLTVIDTPGYGSTEGIKEDSKIPQTLYELFKSQDGVHEIDVVCLVVSAANVRLTQEQLYVFDAILSLFGKDMEKNITVLITQSPKKPINAIKAIKESKVKCAKRDDGEPVHFRFDYSYCEAMNEKFEDEEYEEEFKESWNLSQENMKSFFAFSDKVKTTDLTLTLTVLGNRKQLISCINNFKMRIEEKEKQKSELEQTIKALEQHEKEKKDNNDFEYEVDEPYKVKVPIESEWWYLSKEATCCSVCEENCHYPGCWWVRNLYWCSMMSGGKCTVCTGRCEYRHHVKEGKKYELNTRKVKKTYEDLKKRYEDELGQKMSLKCCLERDIDRNEKKKASLVVESYQCVLNLEKFALKSATVSTLLHLDFLIEKMKETDNTERVQRLEDIKNNCEDACKGLLDYVRLCEALRSE